MRSNQKSMIKSIAILLGAAMLFSCKNDMQEVQQQQILPDGPTESARDVELSFSDSARIQMTLKAALVERYKQDEEEKTLFPEGIEVQFIDPNGQPGTHIRADHAVKYEDKKETIATGNVVVTNAKGERLNTEKLIWDEKNERIFTDEFVQVTTPKQVIMGTGLEADQQFSWYEIKNIKGTLAIDNE